ncbi:MAG: choice-of-anchor D domain-containing protein [Rhizobacter sp.]|nr:choice-of-anchor D domain-containing protein [Burkholderiales bacterium]
MFFDSVVRASRVLVPCLLLACPIGQAVAQANDFNIILNNEARDAQKYLTFGLNGWGGRTVRWRYNDANRATNIVSSSSAAVERIQGAMAKWTAVCNVQFVYDGSTTAAASLAAGARDRSNVIAWGALPGNTAGVAYVSASGVTGQTMAIDEADMVINYQFNPTLDVMLLHEVGHMLGLEHSNQEHAVMSGPNDSPDTSTTYTTLSTLQADDIAGCQALYGASSTWTAKPIAAASVAALAFANTAVGAASATQSVTLTNTGSTALAINYTTVSGNDFALVSTTCNAGASLPPGASCAATTRFLPTTSGLRSGTLNIGHNATPAVTSISLSGSGVASIQAMRQMVEYRYVPLDYYFITSRDSDKATLDATSGFVRTGTSFQVYAQPQGSLRPITRFYFGRVALGASRGSHFYTLLEDDLQTFARQNPTQSTAPGFAQNEDIDSYAFAPLVAGVGGSCGFGLLPVYRLFRGAVRFPDNPNHRFTTSVETYNSSVAMGWDGEGVNFCVPSN